MPTLNRPNAPSRLPSADIENSFFRTWALRSSSLPGSSPPASTPSSPSPLSTTVAQRIAKRTDRRRLQSEGNSKPASIHERTSTSTAPVSVAPGIAQEDTPLLKSPASSESFASENSCTRSSISYRARKLLNIPNIRGAGGARKDGAPPRDAKKGFTWQHQISGHWLEIRIGSTRRSDEQSHGGADGVTPLSRVTPAVANTNPSSVSKMGAATDNTAHHTSRAPFKGPPTRALTAEEGLYCRTKRLLGFKRGASDEVSLALQQRTMTGDMLDRTASVLRLLAEKKRTPPSSSTSTSTLSIATPRWQFQRPGHGRPDSSSSSVRSLLMGKTPMSTPEAQDMYAGSDHQEYLKVELTEPDAPTFLPSEARRINTPPLKSSGSGKGKTRGFFFDYDTPSKEDTSDPCTTQNAGSEFSGRVGGEKGRRVSETEWYRVKLDAIEAEGLSRKQFVFQVPDHLPNSPLCPENPRHKSGGSGNCPMHGKNDSSWSTIQS
ncbi:MAG: hypothetical protein Q9217_003838 [Psora testacea]